MNEANVTVPQLGNRPAHPVRLRTCCIAYIAIWLLTAVAFEVFMQPDGMTETDLTSTQQRIRWPLYTPLMALLGLARAFTWPWHPLYHSPPDSALVPAFLASIGFLLALGCLTITRRHLWSLVTMLCFHAAILSVSVIFYLRMTAELSD
jgi:hypothetical protein